MNGKYGFQFRWSGKLIKKKNKVDPGIYQLTPRNSILAGKAWNSTFIPVWIEKGIAKWTFMFGCKKSGVAT